MKDYEKTIREQSILLEELMPSLLEDHGGSWVLFHSGSVVDYFQSAPDAIRAGNEKFGPHGGQVVAQVLPPREHHISAAALFAW